MRRNIFRRIRGTCSTKKHHRGAKKVGKKFSFFLSDETGDLSATKASSRKLLSVLSQTIQCM